MSEPAILFQEFVCVETGSRQISKVPHIEVPFVRDVYRPHYEPIEDEV